MANPELHREEDGKGKCFRFGKIETISKDIYGNIWVEEDSNIPNINGIRKELIENLKAINTPVIRWGGYTCEVYD